MALGRFRSFRQADVLPELRSHFPEWAPFPEVTEAVLADPYAVGVTPEVYARELTGFFEGAARGV